MYLQFKANSIFSLIFFISTGSIIPNLNANNLCIKGIFPYQHNISFSIGLYENTLVEEAPMTLISTQSDEMGKFQVEIDINRPSILIFLLEQDNIRFYCKPGDTVFLQITNRKNILFQGDNFNENNLLFHENLISDIFRVNSNQDESVDDKFYKILSKYDSRLKLLKETNNLNPDFVSFFNAEIIGNKYLELFTLMSGLNPIDYPHLEKELKHFGDEPLVNESRSRAYNNSLVLLQEYILEKQYHIPYLNENIIKDWYHDFPISNNIDVLLIMRKHSNLYKLFSYSVMNSSIYTSTDTIVLEEFNDFITRLNDEMPSKYLIEILKQRLEEKIRKQKLHYPYFFTGHNLTNDSLSLNIFKGKYVLIDFWATWCKPCLANMQKVENFAAATGDSIVVLTVNIQDSGTNWTNWINEYNYPHLLHLKLTNKESKNVFSNYYFQTVPNYVLLDKNLNFIIKGISTFNEFAIINAIDNHNNIPIKNN